MFLVITVIDERTQEIPFALNVVIGVLGIIRILFDREHLLDYLIRLFCVSTFMLLLLIIGRAIKGVDAFGGGDIKLMAAAGLFMGWKMLYLHFAWLHLWCGNTCYKNEGQWQGKSTCFRTIFVCRAYNSHAFWYEYN